MWAGIFADDRVTRLSFIYFIKSSPVANCSVSRINRAYWTLARQPVNWRYYTCSACGISSSKTASLIIALCIWGRYVQAESTSAYVSASTKCITIHNVCIYTHETVTRDCLRISYLFLRKERDRCIDSRGHKSQQFPSRRLALCVSV